MKKFVPSERSNISPFYAMEILREANELSKSGNEVIHLEVGEPTSGAPPSVVKAANEILQNNISLPYTNALGVSELREAISEYYQNIYNFKIPMDRIAITSGSSAGYILSFLACFNPGDRIILGIPYYPAYRNMISALGLETVEIQTLKENRFQLSLSQIEDLKNIKGIILASPSNPAGTMINDNSLQELCSFCDRTGIRVLSDEIYHGITYEKSANSILGISKNGIVLNGFSKFFCMTGWRLGWLVLPEDLIKPIERLSQNLFISSNALSQFSAIDAFKDIDILKNRVKIYSRNRNILIKTLNEVGISDFFHSDGAFYLYVNVSNVTDNSQHFCKKLLNETGVAITPGIDFDSINGLSYVRFSFAASESEVEEACIRIKTWISKST